MIFVLGVVLFGAAAFFYPFTELVVALLPVLSLAGRATVARLAAAALLRRVRQIDSARGALREDHDVICALL